MITIKITEKEELYPKFGQALRNPDIILVRSDLPRWVMISTIVHELYHVLDTKAKLTWWREIRAILAQLFIPFIGGLGVIIMSLSPYRLKFYIERIKND